MAQGESAGGVVVRHVLGAALLVTTACCGGGTRPAREPAVPPPGCYELTATAPGAVELGVPSRLRLREEPLGATEPEAFRAETLTDAGRPVEYPFDRWRPTADGIAVYAAALSGARLDVQGQDGAWSGTVTFFTDIADRARTSIEVSMHGVECPSTAPAGGG